MACQVAPPTVGGRPALFTVSQTSALGVCVCATPTPTLVPTANDQKPNKTK